MCNFDFSIFSYHLDHDKTSQNLEWIQNTAPNFSPSHRFRLIKSATNCVDKICQQLFRCVLCCFNSIFALFLKAGVFIVPATISTPRLLGSPSISFEEKNEPFFRSSRIISKNTPEQQCHIYDNKQTDTPSGLGFIYRIINSLRSEPVTQQTRKIGFVVLNSAVCLLTYCLLCCVVVHYLFKLFDICLCSLLYHQEPSHNI